MSSTVRTSGKSENGIIRPAQNKFLKERVAQHFGEAQRNVAPNTGAPPTWRRQQLQVQELEGFTFNNPPGHDIVWPSAVELHLDLQELILWLKLAVLCDWPRKSCESLFRFSRSCYRRRRDRLPVRHLPHPPPGLPHEEEGRGQLWPGREETLWCGLSEGPNQGVLCINPGPPTSDDKSRVTVADTVRDDGTPVQTTRNEFKLIKENSIKESFCIEYCN